MKNVLKLTVFSAFLVLGVIAIAPAKAHAVDFNPLNPIDPFCLFTSCHNEPQTVNNTVNSNNTNSFNNTTNVGTNYGAVNAPYTVGGATGGSTGVSTPYIPPATVSNSAVVTTPYQNTTPAPTSNTNYNYNYNTGGGSSYYPSTPVYYPTQTYYPNYYYQTPTPIYYTQPTYYTTPYQYGVYGTSYYNYQQPVYNQPITYAPSLQIACAADKVSTTVGVPITWSAEATYNNSSIGMRYSWTGTEGLFGNAADTIIAYYSPGTKSAVVTVTAPNGVMQSKVCSNTVTVKSTTVAKAAPKKVAVAKPSVTPEPTPTPTPEVSAASLLSLGNVPWGWVGILIILVLLGTIFYLIFNKKKI